MSWRGNSGAEFLGSFSQPYNSGNKHVQENNFQCRISPIFRQHCQPRNSWNEMYRKTNSVAEFLLFLVLLLSQVRLTICLGEQITVQNLPEQITVQNLPYFLYNVPVLMIRVDIFWIANSTADFLLLFRCRSVFILILQVDDVLRRANSGAEFYLLFRQCCHNSYNGIYKLATYVTEFLHFLGNVGLYFTQLYSRCENSGVELSLVYRMCCFIFKVNSENFPYRILGQFCQLPISGNDMSRKKISAQNWSYFLTSQHHN